ncbi:LPXTG cell wall anchor domain-containing protein [Lentzea aerocolonigenes]|uniref:LPXTG cell wall anchor domain-containing protein n=1 Tax=Lentzea aerocolonigenes TaxID=68170 RepID=UPI000697FF75|nr:prenyltransferase/squalene oxidase repeat-containing protein [Lentzea aerocolonigenes]
MRRSALVALVATALVATPQAQAAEVAPAAGTWLVSQFVPGDHLINFPGGPGDPGLTADGVYGLAAAGVGQSASAKAMAWLSANLPDFIGKGEESFTGPVAKIALAAQVQGLDARKFGGVDLIERLTELQDADGRFRDKGDPEWDESNAFTQSLAIIVLRRAALPLDKATTYLVSTQCPDGGFPIVFGEATCKSDVDATTMVLQALRNPAALAWLVKQQQADGGFPAAVGPSNANTTGLAVGALVAGGQAGAADRAVAYLRTLQVGCAGPEAQRGAIAYDSTGFEAAKAVRATAQAMLGLARVGLVDVSAASASAGVPAIECATTPPSTPPSAEPSVPAPAGPAPVDPPLAATGPDQAVPLTLFGSFAVVLGAALLFVSRRRKVGA